MIQRFMRFPIDFLDVDDVGMFNFYQFLCFVTRVDLPRDAV
jgi:hypothetical protein